MQKLKQHFPLLAVICIAVLWAFVSGKVLFQGDTFWHLKAGEWIAKHGIPYADPFSWIAKGKLWHAHEWLWELIAWKAWDAFGKYGIWLINATGILFFALGTFVFCRGSWWGAFLAGLSLFAISSCFSARPHVLAQGLFALWFGLFSKLGEKPKLWPLLPGILLILSNMHASAPACLAFGILWCFAKKKADKPYVYALASSFLATFVNPQGFGLWIFAAKLSFLSKAAEITVEWFSPDFKEAGGIFQALLIVFTAYKLREIKEKEIIACWLVSLLLFLFSMRHLPYFAFFTAGVLSRTEPFKRNAEAVIGLAVSLILTLALNGISIAGPEKLQEFPHPPFKAIQFMKENNLTERVFNYSAWGGMLMWEGISPGCDGRMDMYEFSIPGFIDDYWDLSNNNRTLKILDKWQAQTVIWPKNQVPNTLLEAKKQWKKVYDDSHAVVFTRTDKRLTGAFRQAGQKTSLRPKRTKKCAKSSLYRRALVI